MAVSASHWNEHLPNYPHQEGIWREQGFIVGENLGIYPKLFKLIGDQLITWKDGLNADH